MPKNILKSYPRELGSKKDPPTFDITPFIRVRFVDFMALDRKQMKKAKRCIITLDKSYPIEVIVDCLNRGFKDLKKMEVKA